MPANAQQSPRQQPWLTLLAKTEKSDVSVPFFFQAAYEVSGGRELAQPQVLGTRQPVFVQRFNAQTHRLTDLRLDGFHEEPVTSYLQLIQIIEASNSLCSLIFHTDRPVVAPLLLETFTWTEKEYLAGTGQPTVAMLNLTFTTL